MKEIALSNNKGIVLIDDEDYEKIKNLPLYLSIRGLSRYAVYPIRIAPNKWKYGYLHRLLMNPPIGMETDHINGNGLDNRKENLRIVDKRENASNRIHITKTSKYVGVDWKKSDKKWRTAIRFQGKKRHLGTFDNELDAATTYQVARAVLIEGR